MKRHLCILLALVMVLAMAGCSKEEEPEKETEADVIDIEKKPEITYDDFAKLQFQVGEIIACEEVKKSKKLINSPNVVGLVSSTNFIVNGVPNSGTPKVPVLHIICSLVTPNGSGPKNIAIVSLSSSGTLVTSVLVKS